MKGSPGVIGDDGNPAERLHSDRRLPRIEGQGLFHTCYFETGGIFDSFDGAAIHGRMNQGGVEHSIHADVLAVDGFAHRHVF